MTPDSDDTLTTKVPKYVPERTDLQISEQPIFINFYRTYHTTTTVQSAYIETYYHFCIRIQKQPQIKFRC